MFAPVGFFTAIDPKVLQLHAERIKTALRFANLSIDKAALWMDMDQSLLRRQLQGDGHISYTRLVKLPVAFWQWLAVGIAEQVGVPKAVRRAVRLQLAVVSRKQMARMDADVEDERKRA